MKLYTATAVIAFVKRLEDESAALYQELASKYPSSRAAFESLAESSRRYNRHVDTAYYSVITDALEGGFSFENLDTDDFATDTRPAAGATEFQAQEDVIARETAIADFYAAASEMSRSLMADVPVAFDTVVGRRRTAIEALRAALPRKG